MKRFFFAIVLAMSLAACAGLGTAPANSIDQSLAYSLGAVTSVRLAAADAVTTGVITSTDASAVLDLSDQCRALIDAARLAHGAGDDTTALAKMAIVTQLLIQAQTYVANKGASK